MPVYLTRLDGDQKGQIESFDKDKIKIGRQGDNDLKFDPQKDVSVSGYHAEIYQEGEQFFVRDLKSRNGTLLNDKRLEHPALLKEGDTLQFSSRGPKLLFSSRDPSEATGTAAFESQATLIGEKAQAGKKTPIWKTLLLPIGVGIVSLVAVIGVGYFMGWSGWMYLIVTASLLLLGGGGYLLWKFWQRRKAAKSAEAIARHELNESLGRPDRDGLHDLRVKWTNVLAKLRDSNLQRKGEDPIYALPWLMLLGENGCGKSTLLKFAGPLSSVASKESAVSTQNCDWWFFEKLVLLDTSGKYLAQIGDGRYANEWRELLQLLRSQRAKEPVNGVMIILAADSLMSKSVESLKEYAGRLRQRLDEIVQQLGVRFPVYLTICKCDRIIGFSEFFASLPDSFKGQAMGYVFSEVARPGETSRLLEKSIATISERSERLRLSLVLEAEQDETARRLFLLSAELKNLRDPLKCLTDILFRESPYQDAPFLRGIFFTMAHQSGAASSRLARSFGLDCAMPAPEYPKRELFLRDLISVILPNDRHLVRRTALWRESSWLAKAAGLIIAATVSLVVCGLFLLSFTNNKRVLSRLDLAACLNVAGSPTPRSMDDNLAKLDGCRETIESLNPRSSWQKLALNFGLRHTDHVEKALQGRFLESFEASVFNPLEARMDQSVTSKAPASLLVGAIVQRIQFVSSCREAGRCPEDVNALNLNYRAMIPAEDPKSVDDVTVARLQRTYHAFLFWQADPKVFAAVQAKDLERIRSWLRAGGLREDSIVESTKSQFSPVRIADFWGISSVKQVDAAYTANAWTVGIAPLISGLQKVVPEATDLHRALNTFEVDYKNQSLRQWGEFLAELPQAEVSARARTPSRQIALKVLGNESPYYRGIEVAQFNLSTTLGKTWQSSDLPMWAKTLRRYVALKTKVMEGQKAKKQGGATSDKDAEAQGYLSSYLEALDQLRGELSTTEKSFMSAKKAFEEGDTVNKATHPILKASQALESLKRTIGAPEQEDRAFWMLLNRPIDLAWTGILDETGKYLQGQWNSLLLDLQALPSEQVGGGKIIGFAEGMANAFLSKERGRYVPRTLLGQSVPFTGDFVQYISRLRPDQFPQSNPTSSPPTLPQPPRTIVRTF